MSGNTIKSICRFCYNSCGILVDMEGDRPVRIRGDKDHVLSRGRLCKKGMAALELLTHPDRILTPRLRTKISGKTRWQEISWDQALERTADALNRIKTSWGPKAVVFARGGSKGMADDHMARFANIFGSPNITGAAYICYSPCLLSSKHTYGFWAYPDLGPQTRSAVLWGFNPKTTHPFVHQELTAADAGTLVIDPVSNPSAPSPETQLRLRPGSDLTLALALIKVILEERLYDRDFVEKWTIGFDRLKRHMESFSLEAAGAATWLTQEEIREAARFICRERPCCILWGNALEATQDSYQTCRAICIIRTLSGNLARPGSDVKWSEEGELRRRAPEFLLNERIPDTVRQERIGRLGGVLPDFGYTPHHMVMRAILDQDPYPVRAAYLQNANMICANEDAAKTRKAISSLDFCVATELFMTPTAALADLVLPAASFLEFDSVEQPWHSPTAFVQQKVATVGQARSDCEILNALARKMNMKPVWQTPEACLDFYLAPAGIRFEEFRTIGHISGRPQYIETDLPRFPTPSGKVELYSQYLEDQGFDPLPCARREDHAAEPSDAFPLLLTSRKSKFFYHSSGRQIPSLREACPDPLVCLHPEPAAQRGIRDRDWVLIRTAKGEIRQRACLIDEMDPRVVLAEHGWWYPEQNAPDSPDAWDANLNLLTDGDRHCNREIGSSHLRGIPCQIRPAKAEH